MTLADSRSRMAFLIASVAALVTSPFLAIWSLLAGVVLGIVGATLIPTPMRRYTPATIATGMGLVAGGLIYVLIGLLDNAL